MAKSVYLNVSCTDDVATARGEAIAEALDLNKDEETGRYRVWGETKTACGLYRSIIRIAIETKDPEVK